MKENDIEKLRFQLKLEKQDFANLIHLSINDYELFIKNAENMPAQSILKLKEIMLEEEQKNLIDYYNRFASKIEKSSIFESNKIMAHLDKLDPYLDSERKQSVGPITVEFHPSTYCNHACPGCIYNTWNLSSDKRHNFDMNLLPNLIEDLKELKVKAINLSGGGEPLCHPQWKEIIIKLAKEFDIGLITNGGLLKSDYDVIINNCQWVRFSIDAGSDEVYKQTHGNIADFEKTIDHLKKLVEAKKENNSNITIGTSFLLTSDNYLDIIPAINLFKKIGINYIQIKPIVLFPEERVNLGYIFWNKDIFDLLSTITTYSTPTFNVSTVSHKFIELIQYEKTGIPFKKCYGHALFPVITSDGAVLTCCFKLNDYNNGSKNGFYGKITKENRLIDIWKSDYRFNQGENIITRFCPINCKIAETNKILMSLENTKIQHPNFIN